MRCHRTLPVRAQPGTDLHIRNTLHQHGSLLSELVDLQRSEKAALLRGTAAQESGCNHLRLVHKLECGVAIKL